MENLENILSRLRADDQTMLKELFKQHYGSTCATIHRFVRDKSLVEDLAQNVFIRFWEKRHSVNITTSVGAYIHRMAINEALAYLRKNKKMEIEELTPMTPTGVTTGGAEENILYGELKDKINAVINELPPKCRAIFQLSRFEELTYKEIAEKLGISIKTVENQMGKALKILRERMKGYLE